MKPPFSASPDSSSKCARGRGDGPQRLRRLRRRGNKVADQSAGERSSEEPVQRALRTLVRLGYERRVEGASSVEVDQIRVHDASRVEDRLIKCVDWTAVVPIVVDERSRSPDVALAEVPQRRTEILHGGC